MIDFINNLAVLIFGSVENWNNFIVDDSTFYAEFFTSIVKNLPYLIAIVLLLFLIFLFLFIVYKLIRVFI